MSKLSTAVAAAKQTAKYRKLVIKSAKVLRPITTVSHRYGPEILTGVGIAGGLGTVVLASRATLRLEEIVDQTREAIEYAESPKDAAKARAEGLFALLKLYGPAASLGVASAGAILGAHGIMRRRNVALVAAYKAIETSFEQYRKRVVDELGADKERDIRYGFTEKEIKDKKSGETKTVTEVNPNDYSVYAKIFDEGNPLWSRQAEYNLALLHAKQNYANDLLTARGHVFLNEVYSELGFPHTKAGSIVGWRVHDGGDNYVDFGIYNFASQAARNFINGYEKNILLDFNVDGIIFDKI